MSLNRQQKEAVYHDGPVAVEAGAGTGKTHLMAYRYLWLVKDKGFSPLEIVAVTFTEKAARELRARVRKTLLEGQVEPEKIYELEAAPISTLHALAARICREYPQEAEVHPNFRVLDELDSLVWLREHLEEALEALPQELPFTQLQEIFQALLRQPAEARRAFQALRHRLDGGKAAQEIKRYQQGWAQRVRKEAERATQVMRDLAGRQHAKALAVIAKAADLLLEAADQASEQPREAQDRLGEVLRLRAPRGPKEVRSLLQDIKEKVRHLTQLLPKENQGDHFLLQRADWLEEAFVQVQRNLAACKRRDGVLDFADLEVHALRALQHPHVQQDYRQRWRAFLVDEHQDTNPTQAEILERLFGDGPIAVVGDRKQAIYGFRHADVKVFTELIGKLEERPQGRVVFLQENYRTRAPLLSAVDRLALGFLGGVHQPLKPTRPGWGGSEPYLRRISLAVELEKEEAPWVEAYWVARKVRELLERGLPYGPLEPDQIAILARTWRALEPFAEALEAVGVPAFLGGGGHLLDTAEARDGLALLSFLANPKDDLALLTLLRSPYFAVADKIIHAEAISRTAPSWWEALGGSTAAPLQEVRLLLEALLAQRYLPPSALLQEADLATGYTAVLAHLPGSARRLADYRGFVELVRNLEEKGYALSEVVRYIKTLQREEAQIPRPSLVGTGAVQLMSVHAAKGLEWRVVFLVAMDRRPNPSEPGFLLDPDRGLGLAPGALYCELLDEKLQRQAEEEARLLYVALTRARDMLILSSVAYAEPSKMDLKNKIPTFKEMVDAHWTDIPGALKESIDSEELQAIRDILNGSVKPQPPKSGSLPERL